MWRRMRVGWGWGLKYGNENFVFLEYSDFTLVYHPNCYICGKLIFMRIKTLKIHAHILKVPS